MVPHRLDGPVLGILLEAWVQVDSLWLAEHPETPPIYECGLKYIADPLGVWEEWLSIPFAILKGGIDCKSLAAWRVAELRAGHEAAACEFTQAGDLFHVFVVRGDGSFEDPSTLLGMAYPKQFVWYHGAAVAGR